MDEQYDSIIIIVNITDYRITKLLHLNFGLSSSIW